MKSVLHLINGEHYSGAERVQDSLALCLPKFGYEVSFACLKRGLFPKARAAKNSPLFELPMRGKFDLWQSARLLSIIKRGKFALVNTHTPRTALIGGLAARWAGVPLVHHVHSPTDICTEKGFRNQAAAFIERISLRNVSRLVLVSRNLSTFVQEQGFSGNVISVVHNGVVTPGPLLDRTAPQGKWTLGTVALIRPRKGIEVLLETLRILKSKGIKVRLRAVGGFEGKIYEQRIKRHIEKLELEPDIVNWVGFSSEVHRELGMMDIFVLPSLFGEGLPMVVLEAMAAGVPVVATDVGGIPEAIRNKVDGLVAEAGSATALADAIAGMIDEKGAWERMRVSAYHRQVREFSDITMANGVAKVYDQVLS